MTYQLPAEVRTSLYQHSLCARCEGRGRKERGDGRGSKDYVYMYLHCEHQLVLVHACKLKVEADNTG